MEQSGTPSIPNPTWTLRLSDGREFGPANLDQLDEWARQGRMPHDGLLVDSTDPSQIRSVFSEPRLARILKAPPTTPIPIVSAPTGTGSALIPYRNPHALAAYYCGVFSLIPIIGVLLGIPAFILGIMGYRRFRRQPEIKGALHAWAGIIMGGVLSLLWGGLIVAGFIAMRDSGF